MLAVDVMTPDVATVRPDTTVADAVRLMVRQRISGLPVVSDGGEVVGIVTEGDLLRRVELSTVPKRAAWLQFLRGPDLAAEEYVRTHTHVVSDLMTPDPVTTDAATPLREVVALMERHRVRRVPVLRGGRLVGIISRSDLVRALAGLLDAGPVVERGDDEIRAAIRAELESQGWAGNAAITVEVEQGVVRLNGIAQSEAIRLAYRAAAEQVPGVRAVENAVAVEPPAMTLGV